MKKIAAIFIFIFSFFACIPEYPYLSEEEINELRKPAPFNLAMILDNDVYLISGHAGNLPKQLTFDGKIKTEVKINYGGDKIAYLDENGTPFILDVTNERMTPVQVSTPIIQMDWIDSTTLYMFNGDRIIFEGESIEVPEFTNPSTIVNYNSLDIQSACINKNGEVAYILNNNLDPYGNRLLVIKNFLNETYLKKDYKDYEYLSKVTFDAEGKLSTYLSNSINEDYLWSNRIVYNNFSEALTATTLEDEYVMGDFSWYIFLEERQVLIYAEEKKPNINDYIIYIQDYERDKNPPTYSYTSNTKIYFDFK